MRFGRMVFGAAAIACVVACGTVLLAGITSRDRAVVTVGPDTAMSADRAVAADLSSLGWAMAEPRDARADPLWSQPDWRYAQGSVADYYDGETLVTSIWALKYDTRAAARNDFANVSEYQFQTCGTYAAFGGVIDCSYANGHEKLFLLDEWIIDIATWRRPDTGSEADIDTVRDSLVRHWSDADAAYESNNGAQQRETSLLKGGLDGVLRARRTGRRIRDRADPCG